MNYTEIGSILFTGKQNIPWRDVEVYLKRFVGMRFVNREYGDEICINASFPDEFVHSQYTRRLKGGLAKTKANLTQIIPELIENATNRRWIENKKDRHAKDAVGGWYRYDSYFSIPVKNPETNKIMANHYSATVLVRKNDTGMYLYDVIDIKKEASKPMDS